MSSEVNTPSQNRVKKALQSLQATRMFQRDKIMYGVARVNRYVEDVDGDWLKNWGEAETEAAKELELATVLDGQIDSRIAASPVFSPVYSDAVDSALHQLPESSKLAQPEIKDLLAHLQVAIEADTSLTPEDKAETLEQVLVLRAVGQNPTAQEMQRFARTAIKILKGTVVELPATSQIG